LILFLTDQELDKESGLYNYDARLYDPIIGRFVSADSIVPGRFDSQAFDRYAYTLNNPIKYTDPSGHFVVSGSIAVGYGSYVLGTAIAMGIMHYAVPIAEDVGTWLGGKLAKRSDDALSNKATSSSNPYGGLSTGELNKAEKSYIDLINEHQQKLDDYTQNPDAYDNQGKLEDVSPEMREKIIQGRIKSLEKQIQKQKNELDKIKAEKEKRAQEQGDKEGKKDGKGEKDEGGKKQ
jgi:RHS repeat-associated protein